MLVQAPLIERIFLVFSSISKIYYLFYSNNLNLHILVIENLQKEIFLRFYQNTIIEFFIDDMDTQENKTPSILF